MRGFIIDYVHSKYWSLWSQHIVNDSVFTLPFQKCAHGEERYDFGCLERRLFGMCAIKVVVAYCKEYNIDADVFSVLGET